MSFSSDLKEELARMQDAHGGCREAELAALVWAMGSLIFSKEGRRLRLETESVSAAKRAIGLIHGIYDVEIRVFMRKGVRLTKANTYVMDIDEEVAAKLLADSQLIAERGAIPGSTTNLTKKLLRRRCCRIAYLRGAFLACGSLANPQKAYHLEFATQSEEFAESLRDTLGKLGIAAKTIERKDNRVVYVKDSDSIVTFLALIGASAAILEMENIRVLKDVRNNVNRAVNCETANLEKTMNAAMRQIEAIRLIESEIGLKKLPAKLREVAEIRMANPDATLAELGEMLGNVGKSGVNNRLRRLEAIAREIADRNQE